MAEVESDEPSTSLRAANSPHSEGLTPKVERGPQAMLRRAWLGPQAGGEREAWGRDRGVGASVWPRRCRGWLFRAVVGGLV